MNSHEIFSLFASLGVLLWISRFFGELSRKMGQPSIQGELLAGVLLGPTLLGRWMPGLSATLFPSGGPVSAFFSGFNSLASILLLFVAGFEIRLSSVLRSGVSALWVSSLGMLIPFILGGWAAWTWPQSLGFDGSGDPTIFAFFVATAMSISALPVIAKTLLDLGIYHSRVGTVTMSAVVVDDLVGWMIFAVLLSKASSPETGGSVSHSISIVPTIAATLAFTVLMLTVGTWVFARILPWLMRWSRKILSFCLAMALICAAFTEWLGIHALFGAFIAGVALGNTEHFNDETRKTTASFVHSFFAPVFFAGLGLKVDFIADFHLPLVAIVIVLACAGKILGCGIAARISGLSWTESYGVGMAMNARGAMEIILGSIALQYGLISRPLFVALVVMAIVTSVMAGSLIPRRALAA